MSGIDPFAGLSQPGPDAPAWQNFDADWYLTAYPDVRAELPGTDFAVVRRHYVEQGRQRGYSPNRFFDEAWFMRRHPEIGDAVAEGRVVSGYAEYCANPESGRSPHWLFDEATYTQHSPDLSPDSLSLVGLVNFYDHYIRTGAQEGRLAHLLFDPASYRKAVAAERLEPFSLDDPAGAFGHFLARIWSERLDVATSVYFDPEWYLATYTEATEAIEAGVFACAVQAYLMTPQPTNPRLEFNEAFYLGQHPDVAAAVESGGLVSGYEHFLKLGTFSLDAPTSAIDLLDYRDSGDAVEQMRAGTVRCVFEHYLRRNEPRPVPVRPAVVERPVVQPVAIPQEAPIAPRQPAPTPRETPRGRGHVDFFGYHMPSRGWIFCGWVTTDHVVLDAMADITVYFEDGEFSGQALMASHVRDDLGNIGLGIVLHIEALGEPLGALLSVSIAAQGANWTITPAQRAPFLRDQTLANAVLPVIAMLVPGNTRQHLTMLASRRGYSGTNTLSELRDRVFLEIDEAILCPPNGLALVGWAMFEPTRLRSIRVQCGHISTELLLDQCVRMDRHDVLESVGVPNGLQELRNGFVAYLPNALLPDEPAYIEVETQRGEVAHRGVPRTKLRGLAAIRFLLDRVDVRYGEVAPAFDHVFGPAVTALNRDRLSGQQRFGTIDFGPQPISPTLTVIVSLYGRLDFMEYQFGFMSRHEPGIVVEYIYVLDEPSRLREAEALCGSLYERFRIPLRLIELARNVGFGPANNAGLGIARGEFVCFLNSDVFAGSPDWMERLVGRLRADPFLGAVGPLLLFEDDCVQHQGMVFEKLPEFASWQFPMHSRKGWRRPQETGLQNCLAITGACMVMRTNMARQLGGFDEAYIIGDFEDSDLCLKLRDRGMDCAVDMDVFLYHLERQSQAGSEQRWRMNLTLCNAWTHQRRWGETLARLDAREAAKMAVGA
jgi:GT2 family glycosyltransferase